ncbi:MAG: YhcH/YjgK/YiaL family protein [Planctomycetia bacterium]|nr:YhcH/YjgK/YiaL family protein [Planctomycetia bacterium]
MIICPLNAADRYVPTHVGLAAALAALRRPDLAALADGRHEVDSQRLFLLVARGVGRGQAESPLEAHRRYIDLQYVVAGQDLIGWRPTDECRAPRGAFDADRDIGFFDDAPATWLKVAAGCVAILFPEDAHAPLADSGELHKVVVKLAVEW